MITSDDIQGHWARQWIKAPGFEDHETRVHWMQVGRSYADVRIPATRPDLSRASALGDLEPDALLHLAEAEGFAGHVTLEGTHCTWHREVNWHGTPEAVDVGDISFDGDGRMVEAGVLSEYTELWQPVTDEDPKVIHCSGDGYDGYLVIRGDAFVVGIGRPDKPATQPLLDALKAGQMPAGIEDLFDGLHALGHMLGQDGVADLAIQPFVEGQVVLRVDRDVLTWSRVAFDGTVTPIALHRRFE